jgi:signal recognition particle GTPase
MTIDKDLQTSKTEKEKGFMLRIKASFGGPRDKQGWDTIKDSLTKGDVFVNSAANINETLMRTRKPHKEIQPEEDFKVSVPSNKLITTMTESQGKLLNATEQSFVMAKIKETINRRCSDVISL